MRSPYKKALKKKKFEGLTIHIQLDGKPMSADPKSIKLDEERPEIPGVKYDKLNDEDKEES